MRKPALAHRTAASQARWKLVIFTSLGEYEKNDISLGANYESDLENRFKKPSTSKLPQLMYNTCTVEPFVARA